MKRLPLIVTAGVLLAGPAASIIAFEEIAERSGLIFTADSCPTPNKNQPETMVGGVALLDYDHDGYLDVYLVNGAAIPSLKKESPRYWNRLFHNNRDGTFTDVTERAGVAGEGYGMGVAVGDFDNDGWPDLYVANVTKNQLFRNNHDGLLDLFVSNYCKWEVNRDPVCRLNPTTRSYCHPKYYQPLPNTLYRNNGDGTFTDVSAETGIGKHFGKGMGAVIADYDGDGFMDVFVPNDNVPNFLFHNIGGKKFEEVALESGVAYPQSANAVSGMGADFKDVFNDGKPDIWHTATENESFPLYRNRGGGNFWEVTDQSMLGGTRGMSGWSNGIFDFDNDGWKDLFVARGNVLGNVSLMSNRTYGEKNTVFRNLANGKFRDVSAEAGAGFQQTAPHRGAAFGDLDNDGRVDAVVTVLNGQMKYFHNVSENRNHWILLKLVGTKSNRMAIGAQIRITAEDNLRQYNQVSTACGYASASDSRVHFGLGASKIVREIDIKWPSRIHQVLRDVPADRILTIKEPAQ